MGRIKLDYSRSRHVARSGPTQSRAVLGQATKRSRKRPARRRQAKAPAYHVGREFGHLPASEREGWLRAALCTMHMQHRSLASLGGSERDRVERCAKRLYYSPGERHAHGRIADRVRDSPAAAWDAIPSIRARWTARTSETVGARRAQLDDAARRAISARARRTYLSWARCQQRDGESILLLHLIE